MKISKIEQSPSFARKPSAAEMKAYTSSIDRGLKLLGKQLDVIIHNSSVPSISAENTGIGSLFSRTAAKKLFPFLRSHGVTGIQQEPDKLRKVCDNSPYAPESSAKNIFMTPLEKLASGEYANILSKETFDRIVANNPTKDRVDYPYVRKNYELALREAFENGRITSGFARFKAENEQKYEADALFRIISKIHGDDNLAAYGDETKKAVQTAWTEEEINLFSPRNEAKIKELKEKYKDDYDYFIYQQMILERESRKTKKIAGENGLKIIGDSPVAQTSVDEWKYRDLFLKGKAIGCPPDYFSPEGQRWGFKYYDPEKIFNKDGSLGEVGKILQKKYEDYFESCPGGVRIDHVIGLVDPFIYTEGEKMTPTNSGRIFSQEGSPYRKYTDDEFAELFTKIILPAAEKHGLTKDSIICEDLGDLNIPTRHVMKKLGMGGISVSQFDYRGADAAENATIMLGSHDNSSFLEYTDDIFKNRKDTLHSKSERLAEDIAPQGAAPEQKAKAANDIRTDKKKFILASFVELFTSPAKRVQIFFTDFFGINKTYNRPGTIEGSWGLRLGENFEDDYYKAASEGKAPNFPKLILAAMRHRGLDKENVSLVNDLENSARIIDEKV